ncbi:hypothetical protein ACIRRH_39000 [Kitasatospora sp. NPDC101235]|uniref:hypothetical protein n=1 Tax=Kitasatospora sp. NPDC101235 TaxID=3364101 RepID=UPI00382E9959
MNTGAVLGRFWRSFTGGRLQQQLPLAVERGREGYTLWQRVRASILGYRLPARLAPHEVPHVGAVLPPQPTGNSQSRTRQQGTRPAAGWFELPMLSPAGALTAAGGDVVVLETSSPDGGTVFLVRDLGSAEPEYSLELVLRDVDTDRPLVSTIRYSRPDGCEQILLVPVVRGRVGPTASYVRLPGFRVGTTWAATAALPVGPGAGWDAEILSGSVRAALNQATRDAWRQVRDLVEGGLRGVIDTELR